MQVTAWLLQLNGVQQRKIVTCKASQGWPARPGAPALDLTTAKHHHSQAATAEARQRHPLAVVQDTHLQLRSYTQSRCCWHLSMVMCHSHISSRRFALHTCMWEAKTKGIHMDSGTRDVYFTHTGTNTGSCCHHHRKPQQQKTQKQPKQQRQQQRQQKQRKQLRC